MTYFNGINYELNPAYAFEVWEPVESVGQIITAIAQPIVEIQQASNRVVDDINVQMINDTLSVQAISSSLSVEPYDH